MWTSLVAISNFRFYLKIHKFPKIIITNISIFYDCILLKIGLPYMKVKSDALED